MPKLWEVAKLVRSKNAGPFLLTIDLMFADEASYTAAKRSRFADPALYARIYRTDPARISLFCHDVAWAIKVSMPRPVPSGAVDDRDVFGGQYHAPLVMLEVS